MKFILAAILGLFFFSNPSLAIDDNYLGTEIKNAPVERLFVPHGFDDNDVSEIIVHGNFPNSCYRLGNSGYEIDKDNKQIMLWVNVFTYENGICAQVITPYIQSIKVGILEQGTYKISMRDDPEVYDEVNIRSRVTESPDDFLYAPVAAADLRVDEEDGTQYLNLRGEYPYTLWGCLMITDVKTSYNDDGVLVAFPIMEHFADDKCTDDQTNYFDIEVDIEEPLVGKNLLHIRAINGTSLNRLVDLH